MGTMVNAKRALSTYAHVSGNRGTPAYPRYVVTPAGAWREGMIELASRRRQASPGGVFDFDPDGRIVVEGQRHQVILGLESLVLSAQEYVRPARVARTRDDVVEDVVRLWNRLDGWIPGAAYKELAEALGVDPDRLKHYEPKTGYHHNPEGE